MQENRSSVTKYIQKTHTHISKDTTLTSTEMIFSLHTVPVELVYLILDNVNRKTLFMSCFGVCKRLNAIINTYHPYKVIFDFIVNINLLVNVRAHHFFEKKSLILIKDRFYTTTFDT